MNKYLLPTLTLLASISCSAFEAYIEGDGRVFDFRKGGGATLWAPVRRTGDSVLFGQAHAGYYRNNLTVGTIGGGYRKLLGAGGIGVNGFFDYTKSDSGRNYYQGGAGLEAFTGCWLGRINGYVPKSRHGRTEVDLLLNGTEILNETFRFGKSYSGFDAELGRGICFLGGELWGYGGGYRLWRGSGKAIAGPRFRAEYTYYQPKRLIGWAFSVGGEYTHDRVHKSQGSLLLRLRVPLCGTKKSCNCIPRLCRRLVEPVRRQESIWVEKNDPDPDVTFIQSLFFFSESGTGPGTQANPTNLAGAAGAAGPGDILFALSDDGDIVGSLTMQNAQQLAGFGDGAQATLQLNNGQELLVDKLNPAGIRPTITNTSSVVTATNANDLRLFGVALDDTFNGTTVSLTNANNFYIDDLFAIYSSATSGSAAFLVNSSGSISNSRLIVSNPTTFSAVFNTINIENLVFVDNEVSGGSVSFSFSNLNELVVRRNTFSSSSLSSGLSVSRVGGTSGLLDISDNTITSTASDALSLRVDAAGDWTVTNNVLMAGPLSSHEGISITRPVLTNVVTALTMNVSNNQITSGGSGIDTMNGTSIPSASGSVDFTMIGNSVTNVAGASYSVGHFVNSANNDFTDWCLTIQNNSSTLTPGTALLVNQTPNTVGTTAIFPSDVEATLRANNSFPAASAVTINPPSSVAPNPCPLPTLPTE